jgi:uncharacterized protein HemY
MIKGSMFRGINYKCGMLYYNNGEWPRAIKEFEQIANETDPHIYEMLAKCYLKNGDTAKQQEYLKLAIASYVATGEAEKAERLKQGLTA